MILYFVRDMLFSSKIREAARQLGIEARGQMDPLALAKDAAKAKLIIIDLRLDRAIEALDAIGTLAVTPGPILNEAAAAAPVPGPTIIGFVDHEKTDVMAEATAHGCHQVMAKGQFAKALPQLLADLK